LFNLAVLNGSDFVGRVEWIEGALLEKTLKRQVNLWRFHILRVHAQTDVLHNIGVHDAQLNIIQLKIAGIRGSHEGWKLRGWKITRREGHLRKRLEMMNVLG
jgi:hypothetical protein